MEVLIFLAGAVALLLWVIRMVQTGFSRLLGSKLERMLRRTTHNRPTAFSTGAVTALMLQSSTAVVLMLAGFSSSGMLTLPAALGTVLGAEFGASLAAFLFNLNVQALALPLILLGFMAFRLNKNRTWKHTGRIIIGLGILLLGLNHIGQVTGDLRDSDIFQVVSRYVEADAALAMTLMGVLTWVIHSTLAAVLIIAQFVEENTLSMEAGLYLLFGANLGGAFPAIVAGWSLSGVGRQVVLGNLAFRFVAVGLGLSVLFVAGDRLFILLPDGALGVVIAHSVLNLANGIVLLLLLNLFVPMFSKTASKSSQATELRQESEQPIYLSIDDLETPSRALANVRNEALHMADLVHRMLNYSIDAFIDEDLIKQISEMDDDIDLLHREALNYVLSIAGSDEEEGVGRVRHEIINYMTNLEHIGDIIDSSLMVLAKNKHREGVDFDHDQSKAISQLHDELVDAFRLSQAVFTSDSKELAQELVAVKRKYRSRVLQARYIHLDELRGHHSINMISTQIFMDILRDMQRICSHLTAVAYPLLDRKKERTEA